MKKIILNSLKARTSTAIGIVTPVMTAMVTDVASGKINWEYVKASIVPAVILIVTDIFNEIKRELDQNSGK